jgi:hypothetical protein
LTFFAVSTQVPVRERRQQELRRFGKRAFSSRASRWHHGLSMATRRAQQPAKGQARRVDRATFRPGDYGRVTQADGLDRWWVRSSSGDWIALSYQRVVENDNGTITLLYLQ